MLDNLDIENIDLVLSHSARPKLKPECDDALLVEKELNLDIEKLLSEEDDESVGPDTASIKGADEAKEEENLDPLELVRKVTGEQPLKSIGNNVASSSRPRRLQIFEKITVEED